MAPRTEDDCQYSRDVTNLKLDRKVIGFDVCFDESNALVALQPVAKERFSTQLTSLLRQSLGHSYAKGTPGPNSVARWFLAEADGQRDSFTLAHYSCSILLFINGVVCWGLFAGV